ncbi:hypothetical protein A4G19_04375 [Pasteurellaceae bacterium Macca]|nr:hypothetical protein [Pasteurellaceae bacterium Macca]
MDDQDSRKKFLLRIILITLIGVFIGISAYTAYYSEAISYLSNDPKACKNCHAMQQHYDAWIKGPHSHVAVCNDCHMPHDSVLNKVIAKMDNGFWHTLKFTLGNYPQNIQIREVNHNITKKACLNCHGELTDMIHIPYQKDETIDCTRCHASVGHRVRSK